jgi:hypothetical protein
MYGDVELVELGNLVGENPRMNRHCRMEEVGVVEGSTREQRNLG